MAAMVDEERPRPESPAPEVTIGDARNLARRTRVRIRGRITASPGRFGPREAYLQDDTAGIKVYLAERSGAFGSMAEGSSAIATGVLEDFHGEREILVAQAADLWLDPSVPLVEVEPLDVRTADAGEGVEGRLVRLRGRLLGARGYELTIDDGSGPARVVIRPAAGLGRPRLGADSRIEVIGIAGQYARSAPWSDGYRVMPRRPEDLAGAMPLRPSRLPHTGLGGGAR